MNIELAEFEKVLLPINCRFTDLQRTVINSLGSADVVAGPGSGKTTVLMAKLAGLLEELKGSSRGICVITHTNVAVEEIKVNLKKLGINEVAYPNFIGTIHEFFNYFFTNIAFHKIFINEDIKEYEILDSDQYKKKFEESFNIYKPSNYTYPAPVSIVDNLQMKLSQNEQNGLEVEFIGFCNNFYKSAVHKSFKLLLKRGILRHIDTLSLCEWYINEFEEKILKGFSERFSWVIMDETQDASEFQFSLLNKIIDSTKISYQRYGDPYQALYNNATENVWKPGDHFIEEQLSESTRFGNNIAQVLKTTCVEEYSELNGNPNKYSYKPHLLIFRDKKELIKKYELLVRGIEEKDKEFKQSNKKVSVLAVEHAPLESFKDNYIRVKISKLGSENLLRSMYNEVVKVYLINLNYSSAKKISFKDFIKLLNNELLSEKSTIAKGLKEAFNNSGNIEESYFYDNYLLIAKKLDINIIDDKNIVNQVRGEVHKVFLSYNLQNEISQNNKKDEIYFGTVHGVKGETHKATMLLDTLIKIKYDKEWQDFSLFKLIESYLFGTHTNVDEFDGIEKVAIIKALKSAYVALSRATHLISVAVNEKEYDKDINELIIRAEQNNWIVIRV